MEPFADTNILPLSIAQVDSTIYVEPGLPAVPDKGPAGDLSVVHGQLLAAVVTRVGEVEAAEWAFDQAKAARDVQINAALSSGVPAEKVAEAAGIRASALPAGPTRDGKAARASSRQPDPAAQ
ncbi:hypothetical protein [Pseudarthrobacter albicanus]|uniref:hypothetical protein n=1 Tax=Pseudarthrobacter albicanus TaxID=2823873 RepID=UPI001BAAA379|nr:hypothetical protein [Pseudarthrobacter albicanus]